MCNHNWQRILPSSNSPEIEESKRMDYFVDTVVLGRFGDIFYCDKCGFTGHAIKEPQGRYKAAHNQRKLFFH